jgi:hypothetical protein
VTRTSTTSTTIDTRCPIGIVQCDEVYEAGDGEYWYNLTTSHFAAFGDSCDSVFEMFGTVLNRIGPVTQVDHVDQVRLQRYLNQLVKYDTARMVVPTFDSCLG